MKEFVSVLFFLVCGLLAFGLFAASSDPTDTPTDATDSAALTQTWNTTGSTNTIISPPVLTPMAFGCYGATTSNGINNGTAIAVANTTTIPISCSAPVQQNGPPTSPISFYVGTSVCGTDDNGNSRVALGILYQSTLAYNGTCCSSTNIWGQCNGTCPYYNVSCYVQCGTLFNPPSACQWNTSSSY